MFIDKRSNYVEVIGYSYSDLTGCLIRENPRLATLLFLEGHFHRRALNRLSFLHPLWRLSTWL